MKVINLSKPEVSETVYAIIEKKCIFGVVQYYLLFNQSGCLMWKLGSEYSIVENTIPHKWVYLKYDRNVLLKPKDIFGGDGGVVFSRYIGPRILVEPIENLIKISNVDYELSKYVIQEHLES